MKNIIKIFICFSLIYTPFFVFAGAAEKWEIVENVYDTSKNTVNVTAKKVTQQASNSGVYKVQVPVSASALGKTVKTMMWTGIAVAAVQAMLEGIGWIIDTGSKTIKRLKPSEGDPTEAYFWCANPYDSCSSSPEIAAKKFIDILLKNSDLKFSRLLVTQTGSNKVVNFYAIDRYGTELFAGNFNLNWTKNPFYNPNAEPPQWEIMSDSQLGNEITGKGENKVPLPDAIADAYSPNNPVGESEPAPKATNDALNNANPQPEKEPEGNSETEKEKDENGQETGKETTKFELPKFCEWAPAVCDFFTVQKQDNKEIKENQKEDIAQNKSFFDKVSDWFDWSKQNDDLPPDEKPQINDLPIPDLKEDAIRWSAQCPADVQVPINLQGVSSTITFSWSPWCQLLDMIKPAIIASAYIGAAFIVLGLRT